MERGSIFRRSFFGRQKRSEGAVYFPEDLWSSTATPGVKVHSVRSTTVGRRQSPSKKEIKPLVNGRNIKSHNPTATRQSSKTQLNSGGKQRSPYTPPYRRHVRLEEEPVLQSQRGLSTAPYDAFSVRLLFTQSRSISNASVFFSTFLLPQGF